MHASHIARYPIQSKKSKNWYDNKWYNSSHDDFFAHLTYKLTPIENRTTFTNEQKWTALKKNDMINFRHITEKLTTSIEFNAPGLGKAHTYIMRQGKTC